MATRTVAPSEVSEINVTPMVDVMLVLLIIFMVITPMLQQHISVNMAQARNPSEMADAQRTDAVVLAITRDGKIYLGSDPVTMADVSAKVKDLMAASTEKVVFIKGDVRAKYGVVADVVDGIRAAGVQDIGLLTEKMQGAAANPNVPPPPLP
jgi:biopolymer transport protein ExbD